MERIAVVGAGLIGRAWAMVFARAGLEVRLWDKMPGVAEQALGLIAERLADLKAAGLVVSLRDAPAATAETVSG